MDLLWDRGLIVLDANALLAPYRVRVPTQKLLFDVLEAHHDQLWCPHRAALEYQRNRLTVVAQQLTEYDALRKKINAAKKDLLQRRVDHPVLDADRYADLVQRSLSSIERFIDQAQANHPDVLGEDPDDDSIRDRWDALLTGHVGPPLAVDDAWKKNADARYDAEVPPGFEDRKKDKAGRRYGDLILWCELILHVKSVGAADDNQQPIIFVSDDTKRDWWRGAEGRRLGPDPALTDELAAVGGAPFWMYSVGRFVEAAAARRGWDVDPEGASELRSSVGTAGAAVPAGSVEADPEQPADDPSSAATAHRSTDTSDLADQ